MTRRIIGVALACAASLLLAACASSPSPHGSLRYTDEGTQWCEPTSLYVDAGLGVPLDHGGHDPITIKSIEADGKGVTLVKAWVMPVDEHSRIGSTAWPITGHDAEWAKRVAAKGAVIKVDEHKDLVLHVRRASEKGGEIRDFRVVYTQSGVEHTADTFTSLLMKPQC